MVLLSFCFTLHFTFSMLKSCEMVRAVGEPLWGLVLGHLGAAPDSFVLSLVPVLSFNIYTLSINLSLPSMESH